MAARAAMVEATHPDRVPEHDLLRERRIRNPACGADLLQHDCEQAHACAGCSRRRSSCRPERLRPRDQSAFRARTQARGASGHVVTARHHGSRCQAGRTSSAAAPAGRASSRHPGPGAVLRELREAATDLEIRDAPSIRRRPERPDDDRPASPTTRAEGDRVRSDRSEWTIRGSRRDPAENRGSTRHVRRQQFPRKPVQPGRPRRAPSRLRLQAVRSRDRPRRCCRRNPYRSISAVATGSCTTTKARTWGRPT